MPQIHCVRRHRGSRSVMRVVTPRAAISQYRLGRFEERLRQLPPEKLAVVFDFVSYLAERQSVSEPFQTMLASEAALRRDWERPEEDSAWADL